MEIILKLICPKCNNSFFSTDTDKEHDRICPCCGGQISEKGEFVIGYVNQDQAILKAKQLRKRVGGTIFAFPTEEDNPFSPYAVVMYAGEKYFVFPDSTNISEAAAGIFAILEELKKNGMDADYKRNVRLIYYQAQIDAPSTVMRRLKKECTNNPPLRLSGDSTGEEENILLSARGTLKMSYFSMVEEKNPMATRFMDEYYKLLATRKYGKTAGAIKQEVHKMGKKQAVSWLEQTFSKYIHDDKDIMAILNSL